MENYLLQGKLYMGITKDFEIVDPDGLIRYKELIEVFNNCPREMKQKFLKHANEINHYDAL